MSSITPTQVAGVLNLSYSALYMVSMWIEITFSMVLNVDMVYTLIQPFSRLKVLQMLNRFLKVAFLMLLVFAGFNIAAVMETAEHATYILESSKDYQELLKNNASLHYAFELWNDIPYIVLMIVNSSISLISLIIVCYYYYKGGNTNKCNKDVFKGIVRKQLLFYFVFNVMELCHILTALVEYLQFDLLANYEKNGKFLVGFFFNVFMSRCVVLPLIRLLEPSLLKQVRN